MRFVTDNTYMLLIMYIIKMSIDEQLVQGIKTVTTVKFRENIDNIILQQ